MSHESEAADAVMRESIRLAEAAVRLSAAGVKNLAALALALSKNPKQRVGKTKLVNLMTSGKELKVFNIQQNKMTDFAKIAKQYGVLFADIKKSRDEHGNMDVIFPAEDYAKVVRIFERIGYAVPKDKQAPQQDEQRQPDQPEKEKNVPARDLQKTKSAERGNGSRVPVISSDTARKPSVRDTIAALSAQQKTPSGELRARTAALTAMTRNMPKATPPER